MIHSMRFGAAGRLALVASTAAFALSAHTVRAAEATAVSEIVVTGGLEETLPAQLAQYGNRLDVVTARADRSPGPGNFVDIGMVLSKYVPGLYLAPQSGPFSYNAASLQGSRPSEILYMIDGVRISNRLYNTTPPLDTVPAHMVDHVEVLDGGQGLFFGTQAIAGVINIVTRPFTHATTGRVSIGGDTNDSIAASGYVSGALSGVQLVAYASYDESKGFQPYPDADYQPSGTDRNRGYQLASGGLEIRLRLHARTCAVSASYQHTPRVMWTSTAPCRTAVRPADRQRPQGGSRLGQARLDGHRQEPGVRRKGLLTTEWRQPLRRIRQRARRRLRPRRRQRVLGLLGLWREIAVAEVHVLTARRRDLPRL